MNQTSSETRAAGTRSPAWSRASMLSFGLILAGLTTVGLVGFFRRDAVVTGLPEGPGVRAAVGALEGRLAVESGDLRFASSLSPDSVAPGGGPRGPASGADFERIGRAERWLLQAQARRPWDPRIECLLGHLELARQRYERAERRYRAAIDRAGAYSEARLGLGVALALHAETEGDEGRARALRLQAIAQFAAVEERDPMFLPALYDRVRLLPRVARMEEAALLARRYIALDPGSAWSASLARVPEPGAAHPAP